MCRHVYMALWRLCGELLLLCVRLKALKKKQPIALFIYLFIYYVFILLDPICFLLLECV